MEERALPHDLEAEKSILGAVLIQTEAIDLVATLEPKVFFRKPHQQIFTSMLDLYTQRTPIDFTLLSNRLREKNELDAVGGLVYIASLTDGLPHATNVEHYVKLVREKAALRELVSIGAKLQRTAYAAEQSALDVVAEADMALMRVAGGQVAGDLVPARTLMGELTDVLDDAFKNKRAIIGLQTDWRELDEVTLGLNKSDLIIIAARPGVGKTVMGANIAITVGQAHTVAFFTLEMSRGQMALRMLSAKAGVSFFRMRSGFIVDSDWGKISHGLGALGASGIYVDDTPGISIPEIRAKCRRLQSTNGLDLIVVDYLGLMRGVGRFDNRTQEVGAISRGLKGLAKEFDVPILAMCQLSRKPEGREDKRPQLSDLRESGEIEQDADLVWLLHRPERYEPTSENEGLTEVHVAKHRNGPEGTVKLRFERDMVRFITWVEAGVPAQREFTR